MNKEKLHYKIYDKARSMFLTTSRLPYTAYFSLLGLLFIMALRIEPTYESHMSFENRCLPIAALLALSFMVIVFTVVNSNKDNSAAIFKKLSALPLMLIASYFPFLLIDEPLNNEGGWWIFYALIILCLPLSLILYEIGRYLTDKKEENGSL